MEEEPRDPLELPNSRYNTRISKGREFTNSNFSYTSNLITNDSLLPF